MGARPLVATPEGVPGAGRKLDDTVVHSVLDEIQHAMTQARMELEGFMQPGADSADMEACNALVRSVGGAVSMLEVQGAALLLDEMLAVGRELAASPDQPNPDHAAALMSALVELPAYLERRRVAERENPLLVMQSLNELRSALGKPLLSESALFAPPLWIDIVVPVSRRRPRASEQGLTPRQLRSHLQRGMVQWLTGKDVDGGLGLVDAVLSRLVRDTAERPSGRLWWIARAVVEGIRAGGTEATPAVKRLFAQVDGQLKSLCETPPEARDLRPPDSLLKNLLYYVGIGTSRGPRAKAVAAAFELDEILDTRAAGRGGQSTMQALQQAARALGEQIDQLKHDLGTTHGAGAWTAEDLDGIEQRLRQITDMLGLLGHEDLRRQLMAELAPVQSELAAHAPVGEARILALASALLSLESAIRVRADAGWSGPQAGAGEADRPRDALRQLLGAFVVEIKAELFVVKENLCMLATGAGQQELDSADSGLRRVVGCLRLLGVEDLAAMLEAHRVQAASVEDTAFGTGQLEALADLIVQVEQRLAGVVNGKAARSAIRLAAPSVSAGNPPAPAPRPAPAPARPPAAPAVAPATSEPPAEDDLDDELIEIFLEEVDEILEALAGQVDRWSGATGDGDARTEVRRAFHTIKGSGRAAGAHRMSTLAWAVENVLNRVADGEVAASAEVVDLVVDAVDIVSDLCEELRTSSKSTAPIDPLVQRADELAGGPATRVRAR